MKPITLFYLMQTIDYFNNLEENDFFIIDKDNDKEYELYSIGRDGRNHKNEIILKIREKEKDDRDRKSKK